MIVYSTFYSGADERKHQSSTLLAFVQGIHWGMVNSPHKWPVTRKMFPFDDIIMLMFIMAIPWLVRQHLCTEIIPLIVFCGLFGGGGWGVGVMRRDTATYVISWAMDNASSLTHWGWLMHIWVSKLTIIDSHNGLSPDQWQPIIWTNAAILSIRP